MGSAIAWRSVALISRSWERGMTSSPVPPVPKSLMQPPINTQAEMKVARKTRRIGVLFMPQCLNGIESCRFDGWDHAENQPDGAGEAEGHRQRPARNVCFLQMRIGNLRNRHGQALSSQHAQQPSQETKHYGFDEELKEDRRWARADGFAQAYL